MLHLHYNVYIATGINQENINIELNNFDEYFSYILLNEYPWGFYLNTLKLDYALNTNRVPVPE